MQALFYACIVISELSVVFYLVELVFGELAGTGIILSWFIKPHIRKALICEYQLELHTTRHATARKFSAAYMKSEWNRDRPSDTHMFTL